MQRTNPIKVSKCQSINHPRILHCWRMLFLNEMDQTVNCLFSSMYLAPNPGHLCATVAASILLSVSVYCSFGTWWLVICQHSDIAAVLGSRFYQWTRTREIFFFFDLLLKCWKKNWRVLWCIGGYLGAKHRAYSLPLPYSMHAGNEIMDGWNGG